MAVDMNVFRGFVAQIHGLGAMASPTDFSDADRVQRAKTVFRDKLDARKAAYLDSCVHCGLCADACHFYRQSGDPRYTPTHKLDLLKRFYRREVGPFSWLYKLFLRDITVDDLMQWQELAYDSCTECGRCGLACPMGIDIAGVVNVMRQGLAGAGLIPDELRAVEQEQAGRGTVFGVGVEQLRAAVAELAAQGVDVPLDKKRADVVVLTTVVDILLFKDALRATARIMNALGVDWTVRTCGFEAANFGLLSGYEELQRQASKRVVDEAIACGAKSVIVPECGHAYPALRWDAANELGRSLPFEVLAISEYLGREIEAGRLQVKPTSGKSVTYHDPCKIGRHSGVFKEPRAVLKALGITLIETPDHGLNNWCCGGGAGLFLINRTADMRQRVFELKRGQFESTGAASVVTACGSCRLNFLNGAENSGWQTPIESLVELVGESL